MDSTPSPPSHHERVLAYLDEKKVEYKSLQHVETRTSEESAQVRGVDLSTGGKALLLKLGDDELFGLFVMSASRQLNSKAIKKELIGLFFSRIARTEGNAADQSRQAIT